MSEQSSQRKDDLGPVGQTGHGVPAGSTYISLNSMHSQISIGHGTSSTIHHYIDFFSQ